MLNWVQIPDIWLPAAKIKKNSINNRQHLQLIDSHKKIVYEKKIKVKEYNVKSNVYI